MPSFDVVSEVDQHEVSNGVDQANREVTTRFDFKGTDAKFELSDGQIQMTAQAEFQLTQMLDIVQTKLSRRGVDIDCLDPQDPLQSGMKATQTVIVREGLDAGAWMQLQAWNRTHPHRQKRSASGDESMAHTSPSP